MCDGVVTHVTTINPFLHYQYRDKADGRSKKKKGKKKDKITDIEMDTFNFSSPPPCSPRGAYYYYYHLYYYLYYY